MTGPRVRIPLLLLVLASLAGCSPQPEGEARSKAAVVVYTAFQDDAYLQDLFDAFSAQTGVLVIRRSGATTDILRDLVDNRVSPPADVFVTRSVVDVWQAAEEGALRPIPAESVIAAVPAWARDPDGFWAGLAYRSAVIVHAPDSAAIHSDLTYADLADAEFAGRLCLAAPSASITRPVIAMLIHDVGVRPAELVVRGWIDNLALPVFESETELAAAIAGGDCETGIVSSTVAAAAALAAQIPTPAVADVDGIGIGRHARNPEDALALLEWLFAELPASHFAGQERVSRHNVGLVAYYLEDADKLAERARYR